MLAALLWWGGAEAQDVILLRNADEVKAEVREITDSHILYTLWGGSDKVPVSYTHLTLPTKLEV